MSSDEFTPAESRTGRLKRELEETQRALVATETTALETESRTRKLTHEVEELRAALRFLGYAIAVLAAGEAALAVAFWLR